MAKKKFRKVIAEIVKIEGGGVCDFGHKVGQKFEFDEMGTDKKMCIYALEALMPAINVLLHNGTFPWLKKGETLFWGCPHPATIYKDLGQVIFKLTVKK
jgi:uncharacterized repeat protein (TIGR04076 family)